MFYMAAIFACFLMSGEKDIKYLAYSFKWLLILIFVFATYYKVAKVDFSSGHFLALKFAEGTFIKKNVVVNFLFEKFFPGSHSILGKNLANFYQFKTSGLGTYSFIRPFTNGYFAFFKGLTNFVIIAEALVVVGLFINKLKNLYNILYLAMIWGFVMFVIEYEFMALAAFLGIFTFANNSTKWKKIFFYHSAAFAMFGVLNKYSLGGADSFLPREYVFMLPFWFLLLVPNSLESLRALFERKIMQP